MIKSVFPNNYIEWIVKGSNYKGVNDIIYIEDWLDKQGITIIYKDNKYRMVKNDNEIYPYFTKEKENE